MLPVVYGSFLRKAENNQARYELKKPLLSSLSTFFFMFGLSGLLVSGGFYAYETYVDIPVKSYDSVMLKRYQELNNTVTRSAAQFRQARDNGLDVVKVLDAFVSARKDNTVVFKDVDISSNRYVLNGQVKSLQDGDKFVKALDFGTNKSVSLGKVTSKDNYYEFNVVVSNKVAAKPGKSVPKTPADGGGK